MQALRNKKLYPLYFILTLLSMPAVFLYCLHKFFAINDLQELINFAILILENVGKRSFKLDVYLALILACSPPVFMLLLLKGKKEITTHGKARWATKYDIEKSDFKFGKFFKDTLALFNPLSLLPPTKWFKAFRKWLDFGFVTTTPMLDTNFSRGGFLLGIYKDTKQKVYYDAPLSALIVAPPGAGKSTAVAIPNLLTLPTSCVVLDIKGELCDLTAGYRQKAFKNEIYVFNPLGNDNNLKFNPFDKKIVSKLDFNGKKRLVDEIANTIFVEEQGQDPHWMAKAKELFTFYALYDVCTKNESNFFDIATGPIKDYKPLIHEKSPYYDQLWEFDKNGKRLQIPDSNPQKLFYKQCADQKYTDIHNPLNWEDETFDQIEANKAKGMEVLDEVVRNYARSWADAADEEFASIKSTFNRVMSVFSSYQVRDATNAMSFEYEDLRKKNITLYIKIAQTDIDTLKSLIRVLLESIAKNLMTRESKKQSERIYLILDEFIRFGKMPFLLEMPALCRSYGIVPLYITQSYGLIKKYYGEDDLKTMTDTIAFQILFKMNDADSAESVSKQIGKYTRENRSHSTKDGALLFGGTSSYSMEGTELITAQDILNIPNDEIIILISGFKAKPLKLKAGYYYKEPEMQKRLKWTYDPNNTELLKLNKPSSPRKEITNESAQKPNIAPKNAIPDSTSSATPQESATPELTKEEKEALALAQLKESQELEKQIEEDLNKKTFDEIEAEIKKLHEKESKEYAYTVKDKQITAVLAKEVSSSTATPIVMPLKTYKAIKKDTQNLKASGFSVHITNEFIKSHISDSKEAINESTQQ
ncbi:type IV secretory system conjugative DNA transfer family protein [uncultured Helicobacter sp.]|uniref:type IV secretory system conjugative DNA transfer family protein n=1 Tax=uncultured Helicobacter sp. TaxID=175537 RepID=UPI003751F34B